MIDLSELDALRVAKLSERQQLAARIESVDADMLLIEQFAAMLLRKDAGIATNPAPLKNTDTGKVVSTLHASDTPAAAPAQVNGEWPGLRKSLRQATSAFAAGFTLDDVMEFLHQHYPERDISRVLVSGELWRMNKKEGSIRIVEKGSGNKPHRYALGGGATNGVH